MVRYMREAATPEARAWLVEHLRRGYSCVQTGEAAASALLDAAVS